MILAAHQLHASAVGHNAKSDTYSPLRLIGEIGGYMATIKEIAQKVGVTSAVVSRVLNYDKTISVSEETRNAIFQVAKELNYQKKKIYPPKSSNGSDDPGYYDTKPGWFLRLQNGAGNEQSSHYHADRQRKRGRQTERLSFGR